MVYDFLIVYPNTQRFPFIIIMLVDFYFNPRHCIAVSNYTRTVRRRLRIIFRSTRDKGINTAL